ncbi:MAG: esterase-like activity of phytase family protein [Gemmatimonadaceae bacterium]
MKPASTFRLAALAATMATALPAVLTAQGLTNATFVNGITIAGNTVDLSTGSTFDRRVGMFSDLFYDNGSGDWWGISDRGPGGGLLSYETRVQRFSLTIDLNTGAISNFQIKQTINFTNGGNPMNGIAPSPTDVLGNALDPEGIVRLANGHLLVSDEYGPSLIEFDEAGKLVRRFTTPANLIPRNGTTGVPNFASDAGNTAGKTTNRGFEGLTISPDGKFAYAILQSGMLDEGAGNGTFSRIVKFDMTTGLAVAQYVYPLTVATQGRGVSALVALGGDRFLALERNNRGVGVGATITPADKNVFEINLAGATDVSNIVITNGVLPVGVITVAKSAQEMDLDANTLAALGNKSPEKWEGLAIGPQLTNGKYLILTGTDNDYSVTQNGSGTQFDVWFDFAQNDPYAASIQCPLGIVTGCTFTTGGAAATVSAAYALLPGVLQAYTANISNYVAPFAVVPEPQSIALMAIGLGLLGVVAAKRNRQAA